MSNTFQRTEQVVLKEERLSPKLFTIMSTQLGPNCVMLVCNKKCVQLCPRSTESNAFYLQPSKKPTATSWFINKPVGHNTLQNTMLRLYNLAGLQGFYTMMLYNSGVDEQLVMETTGHISLEGVRSYKPTHTTKGIGVQVNMSTCLTLQNYTQPHGLIIIIIIFFIWVFSECIVAIATSLIPLVTDFPEICAFMIGFSFTLWTKMRPLLAH